MKNSINLLLLKKIIKIPSLSKSHNQCLLALKVIKKEIDNHQIPCFVKFNNNVPFLIAGDLKKARVLFLSHIDVVPANTEQFNLKRKGNKIFGRGVLDMKGPLVATLGPFIKLWQTGQKQFLFAVTSDEEVGGFNGTALLTKTLFKNIKAAIVPDGTGDDLIIIQKAPFHIKIQSTGKSAHGSKPWKGINAAENLSKCCTQIIGNLNQNSLESTTATLTQFHSGHTTNTVPAKAIAIIDIRIKKQSEVTDLIKKLDLITQKWKCSWKKIDEPLFFKTPKNSPFLKIWIAVFKKITTKKPLLKTESGASDARFLWEDLKIPVIITSVIGGRAHSKHEWANIDSLTRLSKIIFEFGLLITNPKTKASQNIFNDKIRTWTTLKN